MASDSGYYYMQRGWQENPIFKDEPYTEREAWEWLIANAAWENHRVRSGRGMVLIKRGETPTSYRKLSEKWGWGVNRVRGFIHLLEKERMIVTGTDTGFLIVTICNYDKYQDKRKKSDTQIDTPTDTQADTPTDTNIRKGKGKDKGIYDVEDEFACANEKNLSPLPEPKPNQENSAAVEIIKTFDKCRKDVFGAEQARPWAHPTDITTAREFVAMGVDAAYCDAHFRYHMHSRAQRGTSPPASLAFFKKSIADELAKAQNPTPKGQRHASSSAATDRARHPKRIAEQDWYAGVEESGFATSFT